VPDPVADTKQARDRIDLTLLEAATALDEMGIPSVDPGEQGGGDTTTPSDRSLVWAKPEVNSLSATEFDIRTEISDDKAVLSLRGEMDVYSAARLRNELNEVLTQGAVDVVLDLEELGFTDSTGLGVMARASRRLHSVGGQLRLRSPQRSFRRVLEITGMAQVFTIVQSDPAG
jgi:anti-sigma B factor antagonist